MAAAFIAARPPRGDDLPGMWIEIRNQQSFDSTGIRLGEVPGRPFEWMLSFRRDSLGRLVVRQVMDGAMPDLSVPTLHTGEDLAFDPNFGADERITYNCRAPDARTLVCLDLTNVGMGAEFTKSSVDTSEDARLAQLRARPRRPDAGQVATVLSNGAACYSSDGSLARVPTSSMLVDAWLVLDGDLRAPIDRRQRGAIIDGSGVTLVDWWRSSERGRAYGPSLTGWNADGIRITETTGDHDVRATLSYSDSAISGEIEDYTIARAWVIYGQRRPCPKR